MPMFPLAGGEIVALILLIAVARWMLRSWWTEQRVADEPPPQPTLRRTARPEAPRLRLLRGGRDSEPPPERRARERHRA